MSPEIQVKGLRDGLLVTLGDGSWDETHQAFINYLDQQSEFLRGARLAVDVGNQILKAAEMGQLRSEIMDRDLILWAVLSDSPTTVQTAQTLGLATRITAPKPELTAAKVETTLHEGEAAILIRRTLRSGYSIQYPGHVIVIGDINPGADVVAGGDIFVWGRARGMMHAGAQGNEEAVICALDLSPTQLRIAGKIALSPQRRSKPQPEKAFLKEGKVVAEVWDPKKNK